jgi:AcrR family transcriptional regulator
MATSGRPREFDREAALHAAMLVFWQNGFLATSMNDLCEAMGIRSPSLYAAFGSKEDLYIEAVERYNAIADSLIWSHIEDGPTARDGVRSVLLAAAAVLPGSSEAPSGCMVNLVAGDGCTESIAKTMKSARRGGFKAFRSGIKRAVASGELPGTTNVDRLSRFFLGVIQGMAIQARDGATRAELTGTAELAMGAWPAQARDDQ